MGHKHVKFDTFVYHVNGVRRFECWALKGSDVIAWLRDLLATPEKADVTIARQGNLGVLMYKGSKEFQLMFPDVAQAEACKEALTAK